MVLSRFGIFYNTLPGTVVVYLSCFNLLSRQCRTECNFLLKLKYCTNFALKGNVSNYLPFWGGVQGQGDGEENAYEM